MLHKFRGLVIWIKFDFFFKIYLPLHTLSLLSWIKLKVKIVFKNWKSFKIGCVFMRHVRSFEYEAAQIHYLTCKR